jgi:hypothetical protein
VGEAPGGHRWDPTDGVVVAALVLVCPAEAVEELRWLRGRSGRSLPWWWTGLERREHHRLRLAEIDAITRGLRHPA